MPCVDPPYPEWSYPSEKASQESEQIREISSEAVKLLCGSIRFRLELLTEGDLGFPDRDELEWFIRHRKVDLKWDTSLSDNQVREIKDQIKKVERILNVDPLRDYIKTILTGISDFTLPELAKTCKKTALFDGVDAKAKIFDLLSDGTLSLESGKVLWQRPTKYLEDQIVDLLSDGGVYDKANLMKYLDTKCPKTIRLFNEAISNLERDKVVGLRKEETGVRVWLR